MGAPAFAETVEYTTSDDARLVADFYPAEGTGREGIVLFHREGSTALEFGALPAALAAQGFHVLVPDLRGHGRSEAEGRSPRATDASPWLRDGPAAIAYLRSVLGMEASIGLVGIGRGAEIAARTIGGSRPGGGALILIDPGVALTGLAVLQPGTGTERPVLIVAGREDARARNAARSLYLLRPHRCHLWLVDGGARIVDRLLERADFAADLAAWVSNAAAG
jgi:alpha-beta hydrolase superfamily lysophospholipase